ncbi:MAG: hypothetical protein M3P22_00890 [bacterium]|nr:hypothetical protein [bacterium]
MSQNQYLKIVEKEIQNINKKIDMKILSGESYFKEARDHKLLLKKIRYAKRNQGGVLSRWFPAFFSFQY